MLIHKSPKYMDCTINSAWLNCYKKRIFHNRRVVASSVEYSFILYLYLFFQSYAREKCIFIKNL